jgi:hypothetical protein
MSAALLANTFLASAAVLPSTGAAFEACNNDKRRYVSGELSGTRQLQEKHSVLLYVFGLRCCLAERNMNA